MSAKNKMLWVALVCVCGAGLASDACAETWPDLARPLEAQGDGAHDTALVVGIEDYLLAPDVPGALQNAQDWYQHLTRVRNIPADRVVLLRNEQATVETLREKTRALVNKTDAKGTLWIVFIGHGAPSKDGKSGLLVGADAQQTATSLYARSLSLQAMMKLTEQGRQAHTVFVIDACFSGQTNPDTRLAPNLQPMLPVKLASQSRVTVLSAGQSNEFAGPLPGQARPAFSYLVLGAMRGWGDQDENGEVTALEATGYARGVLSTLVHDRQQTPEVLGAASDFVMSRRVSEAGPDLSSLVLTQSPNAPGPTPLAGPTGAVPPRYASAVAASGLSFEEWTEFQRFVQAGMTRQDYNSFRSSGLLYNQWVDQHNDQSESMAFEIVKWGLTASTVVDAGLLYSKASGDGLGDSGVLLIVTVGTAALALGAWIVDASDSGAPQELPPFEP